MDTFSISSTPDFALHAEGFSRITRNGKSDIYLVLNAEYPGVGSASLAYELDDFDISRPMCDPLILNSDDKVEPLGAVVEYFKPKAPLWDVMMQVTRMIPKDYGLLPTIRVVEALKKAGRAPTLSELENAVQDAIFDYKNRRAQLLRVA